MTNLAFFQVTLPICAVMVASVWAMVSTNNGRRSIAERLDDIVARLARIEDRLLAIEARLGTVEVRR